MSTAVRAAVARRVGFSLDSDSGVSVALPVFRLGTVLRLDVGKGVYGLFAVELLFAVLLAVPAWYA